jgi:hypothetical protein
VIRVCPLCLKQEGPTLQMTSKVVSIATWCIITTSFWSALRPSSSTRCWLQLTKPGSADFRKLELKPAAPPQEHQRQHAVDQKTGKALRLAGPAARGQHETQQLGREADAHAVHAIDIAHKANSCSSALP